MKIKIGEVEKEGILSIETLMVYEEEFGRDLIQDYFGKVEVRRSDLKDILPEEDAPVEDDSSIEEEQDDVLFSIDYTTTNWTAITRVLWAALRTADRSIPAYQSWVKTLEAVNLNEINNQLTPECVRQFFRQ